jgi:hypothetical protein
MNGPDSLFSRRSLLAGALVSSALAAPALAAPHVRQAFSPAEPANRLQGLRKVLFAGHEELVFWWMKGTASGLVDSVATPLYGMEVATILRCRTQAAPAFEVTSIELVFYTDLATGALLERWQNPYTGASIDMHYVPVGPTRVVWTTSGPQMPSELPGARIESTHTLGPVTIVGDDVWIRNDSDAVVTRTDGEGRAFRVHDWATYHARLADVENDSVKCAEADVSFMDITSWPRSFQMGERPGTRLSRCAGRKVDALERLPESYLALLERTHPEIRRNPAGALEAAAHRFER